MAELEYIQCPCCGWRRSLKYGIKKRDAGAPRKVDFAKVDPGKVKVWQLVELGSEGRGRGIMQELDSETLENLREPWRSQIREQCKRILEVLGG